MMYYAYVTVTPTKPCMTHADSECCYGTNHIIPVVEIGVHGIWGKYLCMRKLGQQLKLSLQHCYKTSAFLIDFLIPYPRISLVSHWAPHTSTTIIGTIRLETIVYIGSNSERLDS